MARVSDLRVSAGDLKGRKLRAGEGRPTTGRVREAVFSVLASRFSTEDIDRALDLFCGSGAMAIEALSRGAASAVLVDRDPAAAEANVRSLGLEERAEVVGQDVLVWLDSDHPGEFDLIFCDPPYTLAATEMAKIEPEIDGLLSSGGLVVVESPAAGDPLLGLPVVFDRTWGRTRVSIHAGADR